MSKKRGEIVPTKGYLVRYEWFNRPVFFIGRLDKVLTREVNEAKIFPTPEAAEVARKSLMWFAAEITGEPVQSDGAELVEVA